MASVPGLARLANIDLDECLKALEVLQSRDEWSRSPEHEGRRIKRIDGGWLILNYVKYRNIRNLEERKAQNREAQQRSREKRKSAPQLTNADMSARSAQAAAEAFADSEAAAALQYPTQLQAEEMAAVREEIERLVSPLDRKSGQDLLAKLGTEWGSIRKPINWVAHMVKNEARGAFRTSERIQAEAMNATKERESREIVERRGQEELENMRRRENKEAAQAVLDALIDEQVIELASNIQGLNMEAVRNWLAQGRNVDGMVSAMLRVHLLKGGE